MDKMIEMKIPSKCLQTAEEAVCLTDGRHQQLNANLIHHRYNMAQTHTCTHLLSFYTLILSMHSSSLCPLAPSRSPMCLLLHRVATADESLAALPASLPKYSGAFGAVLRQNCNLFCGELFSLDSPLVSSVPRSFTDLWF